MSHEKMDSIVNAFILLWWFTYLAQLWTKTLGTLSSETGASEE